MRKTILPVLFVLLFAAVGLLVYYGQHEKVSRELEYSGVIEATRARLSFQVPGRVAVVHVREGEPLVQGQVVAELDRAELEARYQQAEANLARAVKAKEQAESVLTVYEATMPAEVARAEAGVRTARDTLADARKNYERFETLFGRSVISEKERDAMKLNFEVARSRLAEAESLLALARGNLARIETARRDVEAAAVQIEAAGAALRQAAIQLDYRELRSPLEGIVASCNIEPGETVTVGREVMTVSDLSRVDLKIFVEGDRIGMVKPGQKADVTVDTFPGKVYEGVVSFISPEGEFTPKFIQTRKERVRLVYMVKISIDNPHMELKTGMPADAVLHR